MFLAPVLMSLALASDPASGQMPDRAPGQPTAKVRVGKDTTVVTGPLDEDGYINYRIALNERLAKNVTPENNASILLWKAFGPHAEGIHVPDDFFKQLGMERPPDKGDYFVRLDSYLKEKSKLPQKDIDAIEDQMSRSCKRPWSAKDYPYIAEWLLANNKPLALAIEASQRSLYFNPLLPPRAPGLSSPLSDALCQLPQIYPCRDLARALAARALLRVHEGKMDAAWQDLLACHCLARILSRGATIVETLIGIALEGIADQATLGYLETAKLTATQVRQRLNDLRGLPSWSSLADKVDMTERFCMLDALQYVRRYGNIGAALGLSAEFDPEGLRALKLPALDQIDWTPGFRNINHWLDRYVAALHIPDAVARRKEINEIQVDLEAVPRDSVARLKLPMHATAKDTVAGALGDLCVSMLLLPKGAPGCCDRNEQFQRNEEIAFALAAYRLEKGQYPSKLDELVPTYLASIPGDLFSGKALIYRPSGNGYLLYSIGPNGKDDGGRFLFDEPPGDDIALRMPLPPLTRR